MFAHAIDDHIWDLVRDRVHQEPKNPERLLHGDMAETFFQAVLKQLRERNLLSDEHPRQVFGTSIFLFAGADANFRIYNPAFGHFNHRAFASLNGTTTDSVRKVWRARPSPQSLLLW